jgi:hypothetical protein
MKEDESATVEKWMTEKIDEVAQEVQILKMQKK